MKLYRFVLSPKVLLLLTLLVLAISSYQRLWVAAETNYGLLLFNHSALDAAAGKPSVWAESAIQQLELLRDNSGAAKRGTALQGLALTYLYLGNRPQAIAYFRQDPAVEKTLLVRAESAQQRGDHQTALYWAGLAREVDPALSPERFETALYWARGARRFQEAIEWLDLIIELNPERWDARYDQAMLAQQLLINQNGDATVLNGYIEAYRQENQDSYIINPDFARRSVGWMQYPQQTSVAAFTTTPAGGRIESHSPDFYGGWLQVLALEPGKRFRYSARIRTQGDEDFLVQPLYWEYIAPTNRGHYSGIELRGSQDWQNYTVEFTAPRSERGIALYPALLHGHGVVWIRDVELVAVDDTAEPKNK
ncbi:MAG TPA: hypothetical protein PKE45_08325 [Caldilineaceae bacterium]|nr:hypothetical protein [Caldilineaceae bacterium]